MELKLREHCAPLELEGSSTGISISMASLQDWPSFHSRSPKASVTLSDLLRG
jgi:hypothetical protein